MSGLLMRTPSSVAGRNRGASSRSRQIRARAALQTAPVTPGAISRASLASWNAALVAAAAVAAPHPAAAAVGTKQTAQVADAAATYSASSSNAQVQQDPLAYSKDTQLCITPFGVDIAGISLFVALAGAAASGITARKRKDEAERLNEQLRKINLSLRQQARSGTLTAPGLQYAPPSSSNGNGNRSSSSNGTLTLDPPPALAQATTITTTAAIKLPEPVLTTTGPGTAAAAAAAAAPVATVTLMSMDEEDMTSEQLECKRALKTGKALLKEQDAAAALPLFERALTLSKCIGDLCQERRATRGLAAASRLKGQYKAAINHLLRVLEISNLMREYTGDADAYGSIADCYTEIGDWETAAEYYDKYIQRMESSVV